MNSFSLCNFKMRELYIVISKRFYCFYDSRFICEFNTYFAVFKINGFAII